MTDPNIFRQYLNKLTTLCVITEASNLSAGEIKAHEWRFKKFIDHIQNGLPFYLIGDDTDEEIILEPTEADRFLQMDQNGEFKGSLKALSTNGTEYALSKFRKTAEFGGAGAAPGGDGKENKEGVLVKPSQIGICDKFIAATALDSEIINNTVLASTTYGKVVIGIAQNIANGVPPTIDKKMDTGTLKAIVDYAGEYLGVLALVKGQSKFANRKEFLEWLGGNIDSLQLNFPKKSNTPLADSYAAIIDTVTQKQINISSKGTGGGAAPSLSSLKIPDNIRKKSKYKIIVDLIELCQNKSLPKPTTISQVYQVMNLIREERPQTLSSDFKKLPPWPESIVELVNQSIKTGKPMPQYVNLTSQVEGDGADGGKLTYVVKKEVMRIVNNELPEFQAAVLEILDYNFIQQYTEINKKAGILVFNTQWPAKLDGVVTMETKSGTTDPTKGGFSFKLKPKGSKADDLVYVPAGNKIAKIDADTEAEKDQAMHSHLHMTPVGSKKRQRESKEIFRPREKR
jgi:hypothetical protein